MNYKCIPSERCKDITYGRIVVDYIPQKEDPDRTILIVGGDIIDYPGYVITTTDYITTAKIVCNSAVSTPKAKYICVDIHIFYLGTPLNRYQYLCIANTLIPDEIIQ